MACVAVVQEVWYTVDWRNQQINSYKAALAATEQPDLALGPQSLGFARVLYWIQIFLCNSSGLIVGFWAVALAMKAWAVHIPALHRHQQRISVGSKVLAYVASALTAILRATVHTHLPVHLTVFLNFMASKYSIGTYFRATHPDKMLVFVSFSAGSISIILILIKYLLTRIDFRRIRSGFTTQTHAQTNGTNTSRRSKKGFLIDPWLVWRFSIACILFCCFNVYMVWYSMHTHEVVAARVARGGPDFSLASTIFSWIVFIPIILPSVVAFLLFGTTTLARSHYRSMWQQLVGRHGGVGEVLASSVVVSRHDVEKGRDGSTIVTTVAV